MRKSTSSKKRRQAQRNFARASFNWLQSRARMVCQRACWLAGSSAEAFLGPATPGDRRPLGGCARPWPSLTRPNKPGGCAPGRNRVVGRDAPPLRRDPERRRPPGSVRPRHWRSDTKDGSPKRRCGGRRAVRSGLAGPARGRAPQYRQARPQPARRSPDRRPSGPGGPITENVAGGRRCHPMCGPGAGRGHRSACGPNTPQK